MNENIKVRPPVSVVIPTYNGLSLLKKNLPLVLATLSEGDELIITDDCSSDESVNWLNHEFSTITQAKNIHLKVIKQKTNLRFAENVNRAVNVAANEFIFLINNDVVPEKNCLNKLTIFFEERNNNNDLFAVGCLEVDPKTNKISGRNQIEFKRGMFVHSAHTKQETGNTAWISGGSGLFSKSKWLELNGFDGRFAPAYWEDIDLSARAKSKNWQILFFDGAKVEHRHESTNADEFGGNKIEQMSWKNALLFTQIHASVKQRIQHFLWKPYWLWQMRRLYKKELFTAAIFSLIIVAAILLRFNKLGVVPHGFAWDEAAIGYNGFAIFNTRRDEWLTRLPISFKSFGDYKAPLAIYLNGLFTAVFGLSVYGVRLPFAIASIFSIIGIYFLAKNLLIWSGSKSNSLLPLISMALLAFSPIYIHYSRLAFESGLAVTFVIYAFSFLLSAINSSERFKTFFKLSMSGILFSASLYTYHSSKITVPLLILATLLLSSPLIKKQLNSWRNFILKIIVFSLVLIIFSVPLIKDSFFANGLERSKTIVFAQKPLTEALSISANQFLLHLNPKFLIFGETTTFRHGDGHFGFIFPTTAIVLLVIILRFKQIKDNCLGKFVLLNLIWFLICLLPAAVVAGEVPHSNRALLAAVPLVLLAALGWQQLIELAKENKKYLLLFAALIIMEIISFGYYLQNYYSNFSKQSSSDFVDGYIDAFSEAVKYEKGLAGYKETNKIIFSNYYQQAYIYAIFVRKTNPIWYQGGSLSKYLIVDKISLGDYEQPNTVIFASKNDPTPETPPTKFIYGSDGSEQFKIYVKE